MTQLEQCVLGFPVAGQEFQGTCLPFACKCTDSVTSCICMHPNESPTDIYANSGSNLHDVNEPRPSSSSTFLEQWDSKLVMKCQGHYEDMKK